MNEARTIRLKHPHSVPLLDFSIASDDVPSLAMKYADQDTLRELNGSITRRNHSFF